jgi:nucleoside-diphosphate-sugar epimerase
VPPTPRNVRGMTLRTALVTGVSGHVASRLAERLQAAGVHVRALVRAPEQAEAAAARGMEPWRGDLTEPGTLAEAVAGVGLVVHAAAYLGQDWDLAQAVNADGTRHLAEAALAAGVGRFVHISTMSVHGHPQPDGLTEGSPLALESSVPYVATKARAELVLAEISARGLEAVVLRPGAICATVNSSWGDELVGRLRDQGWPQTWHPGDVIPWGHADDLAEMTWLAATHPDAGGQTYLAVDRCVAIGDYFWPIIAALGGAISPPDREPALSRCVIGKIGRELGYSPRRTFEHTLQELVDQATASLPALAT